MYMDNSFCLWGVAFQIFQPYLKVRLTEGKCWLLWHFAHLLQKMILMGFVPSMYVILKWSIQQTHLGDLRCDHCMETVLVCTLDDNWTCVLMVQIEQYDTCTMTNGHQFYYFQIHCGSVCCHDDDCCVLTILHPNTNVTTCLSYNSKVYGQDQNNVTKFFKSGWN